MKNETAYVVLLMMWSAIALVIGLVLCVPDIVSLGRLQQNGSLLPLCWVTVGSVASTAAMAIRNQAARTRKLEERLAEVSDRRQAF